MSLGCHYKFDRLFFELAVASRKQMMFSRICAFFSPDLCRGHSSNSTSSSPFVDAIQKHFCLAEFLFFANQRTHLKAIPSADLTGVYMNWILYVHKNALLYIYWHCPWTSKYRTVVVNGTWILRLLSALNKGVWCRYIKSTKNTTKFVERKKACWLIMVLLQTTFLSPQETLLPAAFFA